MKIGILGGSFDPIHVGHVALALAAHQQFELDAVYVMLSPQSPFKMDRNKQTVRHRAAMIKRAIRRYPQLRLGLFECRLKGPHYTVKTLAVIKKKHPQWNLFFIMGSDAWNEFHGWKNPLKFVSLAKLIVARRPGNRIKIRYRQAYAPAFLKGTFPEISSSAIRKGLAGTKSLRQMLDPQVEQYIRTKGLYGAC